MGLILIVIGAVCGWRSGGLAGFAYALFAASAVVLAGLWMVLQRGGAAALLSDPIAILLLWLVVFLELAVPYTMLAWLKAKRVENRGE